MNESVWTRRRNGLAIALAVFGAIVMISPFILMLSTSVASETNTFTWPPKFFALPLHWSNYWRVFSDYHFGRYLLNSTIIAVSATLISVTCDALAGYALAKIPFPGKNAFFVVLLATIMVPAQVTIIPLFILFRTVPLAGGNDLFGHGGTGLLNTFPALILPNVASVFGTYLMREFFRFIPDDLREAGRVDGLGDLAIFRRIYLPLAKPALAAVAIISFTETWNAFLWPLIATSSASMQTVQLGLASFRGQYFTHWELLMAAVVVSVLPVFVVFVLGQRAFVQGLALTGLKG